MAVSTRTDEQIQVDVLEELKWDTRLHPNEIGVVVKDGIVTLTGWVDSYLKKIAAEEAAHRVRGVKAVANDIEVRLPTSSERTDADLAKAAVNALRWEAAVPAGDGAFLWREESGGGRGMRLAGGQRGGEPHCDLAPLILAA